MKEYFASRGADLIGKCLPLEAQLMLAKYFLKNEDNQNQWKHILLVVGRRKRSANGVLGNFTTAVNMVNDKRVNIFIESHLIDNQDVAHIEQVLRGAGINMADENVSIFIQIAQKVMTNLINKAK